MQIMHNAETMKTIELIESINKIDSAGSYSLFIRHGDRDKIPEGEFGNDVELNRIGFVRSEEFGRTLSKFNINSIFTSPIIRCVQTADSLTKGIGRQINIETSTILGDPGAFVSNAKQAGESFLELGFDDCYHKLLENKEVIGNRSIIEGSRILTDFFNQKSNGSGLNIFVSHDMIIALYSYAAFNKKFELGENWIKYLGGLLIKHN
jgi:broad specificity phosphatase PhoE